jgi:hypothetical protein
MRPWQFSKPKNPGFGISKGYYLSILASHAVLPTVRELANPNAEAGALEGFAVPLQGSDKTLLERPMERGYYAIAAKDQKTVLKLTVVSKEEAGFDSEAFARSELAVGASSELLSRVRATWTLCQLTFESHHPMVYPALDFLLGIAKRLAELSEGTIADPISQRYLLPDQVFSPRRERLSLEVYAEEHIVPKFRLRPDGLQSFTLGMQKFAMPELEILNMFEGDEAAAAMSLLWLSQKMLEGTKIAEGYEVGDPRNPFEVRIGGFDKGLWEGIPVWELLPPTSSTTSDALRAWQAEILRTG